MILAKDQEVMNYSRLNQWKTKQTSDKKNQQEWIFFLWNIFKMLVTYSKTGQDKREIYAPKSEMEKEKRKDVADIKMINKRYYKHFYNK